MADLQTFRERVPIVGRMVEKAFNGDKDEDDTDIEFILVTCKREGLNRVVATLANITDTQTILGLLLKTFEEGDAKFSPVDDETVGHA